MSVAVTDPDAPDAAPTCPLAVVIVNFRTPDLTLQCLESAAAEVPSVAGCRVVVVDNGSGDGSGRRLEDEIVRRGWSAWARLVPSEVNRGFAGGNNVGIRAVGDAERYLLLNSDTILRPGCLRACVDAMREDGSIGALSGNVLNADGSVQNVARRFPTPARQVAAVLGLPWKLPRLFGWADLEDPGWDRRSQARDVDWLGGAFLMLRGDVLRTIGGLDESFFFYGEDIALCHRVRALGYRCRYDPGGEVVHLGGASPEPSRIAGQGKAEHAWRARYLLQRRCYGRGAELLLRVVDVAALSTRWLVCAVRGSGHAARRRELARSLRIVTARAARASG